MFAKRRLASLASTARGTFRRVTRVPDRRAVADREIVVHCKAVAAVRGPCVVIAPQASGLNLAGGISGGVGMDPQCRRTGKPRPRPRPKARTAAGGCDLDLHLRLLVLVFGLVRCSIFTGNCISLSIALWGFSPGPSTIDPDHVVAVGTIATRTTSFGARPLLARCGDRTRTDHLLWAVIILLGRDFATSRSRDGLRSR
jgi:hypothetical protein